MKITKKQIDLKEALNREWILANGTGGFCSTTIIGANTRRYHGLLVAPLVPPAQRHVLVSKVDESIEINGNTYNLYTNLCKKFISDGYKNLESFENNGTLITENYDRIFLIDRVYDLVIPIYQKEKM